MTGRRGDLQIDCLVIHRGVRRPRAEQRTSRCKGQVDGMVDKHLLAFFPLLSDGSRVCTSTAAAPRCGIIWQQLASKLASRRLRSSPHNSDSASLHPPSPLRPRLLFATYRNGQSQAHHCLDPQYARSCPVPASLGRFSRVTAKVGGPNPYKVIIALEELGVPYEKVSCRRAGVATSRVRPCLTTSSCRSSSRIPRTRPLSPSTPTAAFPPSKTPTTRTSSCGSRAPSSSTSSTRKTRTAS